MPPKDHQGAEPSCVAHPASPKSAVWGWPWELGLEAVTAQAHSKTRAASNVEVEMGPSSRGQPGAVVRLWLTPGGQGQRCQREAGQPGWGQTASVLRAEGGQGWCTGTFQSPCLTLTVGVTWALRQGESP